MASYASCAERLTWREPGLDHHKGGACLTGLLFQLVSLGSPQTGGNCVRPEIGSESRIRGQERLGWGLGLREAWSQTRFSQLSDRSACMQ